MNKQSRILILCPYPYGVAPAQRLKYEPHIEFWRQQGYDVDISPYLDMTTWGFLYERGHFIQKIFGVFRGHMRRMRDLLRLKNYDLIYVAQWVTPFGTTFFERLVRALHPHIVLDIEDNQLGSSQTTLKQRRNPIMALLLGPSKSRFLVANADKVITASPLLSARWNALNRHLGCVCITPSLDMNRYRVAKTYANDHKIVIGWTGTFSTKVYLDTLRPVFARLARLRQFKLLVIGNFDYDFGDLDGEMVQWNKASEIDDLARMDIGVYPLTAETDWVLGKAGLKAMQYMAMGLPCVATDISTTPLVVQNEQNGILVNSDDEWVVALSRLIDDAALRQKLGQAGRRTVEEKYSLEAVRRQYIDIFKEVLAQKPAD